MIHLNDKKINNILVSKKELKGRPLILDGAIGSYLEKFGVKFDKYLWSSLINLSDPAKVKMVHKKYFDAGADILTTNTFRTNPTAVKYSNHSIDVKDFVEKSVDLCKSVSENSEILIAGCNPPAEDCYQRTRNISKTDLGDNHKYHIDYLYHSGVNFILNETIGHWDELEIISKFCSNNSIPYSISLFVTENLTLLSGEPLADAISFVKLFSPMSIGVNCINIKTYKNLIIDYPNTINSFYLNCGDGNYTDNHINCAISPENYFNLISDFINPETIFIGSCCGSTPEHTAYLKQKLDEKN